MADTHQSELARRLLRRATDPIGAIDVRRIQDRYERATAWPRQHMTLLGRSVSRAQVDVEAGQGQPMTLAARAMDSVRDALEMTSASAPSPIDNLPPAQRDRSVRPASSTAAGEAAGSSAAAVRTTGSRAAERGTTITGPAMHAVSRASIDAGPASRPEVRAGVAQLKREQPPPHDGGERATAREIVREQAASSPLVARRPIAPAAPASIPPMPATANGEPGE